MATVEIARVWITDHNRLSVNHKNLPMSRRLTQRLECLWHVLADAKTKMTDGELPSKPDRSTGAQLRFSNQRSAIPLWLKGSGWYCAITTFVLRACIQCGTPSCQPPNPSCHPRQSGNAHAAVAAAFKLATSEEV